MALVKLEGSQMAAQNVKKPWKMVPSFLSLLCREVKQRQTRKKDKFLVTSTKLKHLITKL